MNQILFAQGGATMLIILLVMIAMMYFTAYKPAKKQREQQEERKKTLKVGDEVLTVGGIKGEVVEKNEYSFVIKTKDGSQLELINEALSHILTGEERISSKYVEKDKEEEKKEEK